LEVAGLGVARWSSLAIPPAPSGLDTTAELFSAAPQRGAATRPRRQGPGPAGRPAASAEYPASGRGLGSTRRLARRPLRFPEAGFRTCLGSEDQRLVLAATSQPISGPAPTPPLSVCSLYWAWTLAKFSVTFSVSRPSPATPPPEA